MNRKCLTSPSDPKYQGSLDNKNDDLIVSEGDLIVSSVDIRYHALSNLGSGTFGQVFECSVSGSEERVAIKVIKNQAAYYHQARVEIGILQLLNTQADPHDERHIVRLKDFFMYHGHLCLAFELLNLNLYELIRRNKFRGLSLSLVRVFITHILEALAVLKGSSIIHCDIKPENILLKDAKSGEVKLIDFGSACFKNRTIYTYIQSRFYRSPEVVLGYAYTESVDMWSLGCVAAELFLGLPLFPAASEYDLLSRITETIGPVPRSILVYSRHASKYYTYSNFVSETDPRLLTAAEFQALHMKKVSKGKQYFKHTLLRDIIHGYPFKAGMTEDEKKAQIEQRECFVDFLLSLLNVDPRLRLTPLEALSHPFIAGPKSQRKQAGSKDNKSIENKANQAKDTSQGPAHEEVSIATKPAQQHPASAIYKGMADSQSSQVSQYTPSHSLQKIVNYRGSYVSGGAAGSSSGSLPMPMMTPPSRSLGAQLQAPVCSEPLPKSNEDRVVPIMEIPGQEPAFQGSFQPSSVRTFRNTVIEGQRTRPNVTPSSSSSSLHLTSGAGMTSEQKLNMRLSADDEEKGEWGPDEDPLWNDDDDYQTQGNDDDLVDRISNLQVTK